MPAAAAACGGQLVQLNTEGRPTAPHRQPPFPLLSPLLLCLGLPPTAFSAIRINNFICHISIISLYRLHSLCSPHRA